MVQRNEIVMALSDLIEEKPIETCCKCEKKASVRSYGGEVGDYCFDCHFDMLKRINHLDD